MVGSEAPTGRETAGPEAPTGSAVTRAPALSGWDSARPGAPTGRDTTLGPALPGWDVEAVLASRADRVVVRARRAGEPPVVLKTTLPGAGWTARAALRREARLLDRARREGVVDLLEVLDQQRRTALVLAFVPAGTLATRAPPDPTAAERRLESTICGLHDAGIVHGAIRAEHVALDADGLPVLVGFGSARRSSDTTADDSALAALVRTLRGRDGGGRPRSRGEPRGGRRRP